MIRESSNNSRDVFTPFQKSILEIANDVAPGLKQVLERNQFLADSQEREKRKALLSLIEQVYEGTDLQDISPDILAKADIEKVQEDLYRIKIDCERQDIPVLSEEYSYSGSAARVLLIRSLGIDPSALPRDFDIFPSFSYEDKEYEEDERYFKSLLKTEEVDIQNKEDGEYFKNRDFTINELYALGDSVVATKQCILDTIRGIIRLTDYEYRRYSGNHTDAKIILKMIRFYSEAMSRGFEMEIYEENGQFEPYSFSLFWIAVNLDKAASRGSVYLEDFINQLRVQNILPQELFSTEQVLEWTYHSMQPRNFYFRYVSKLMFEKEEKIVHELIEKGYDKKYARNKKSPRRS